MKDAEKPAVNRLVPIPLFDREMKIIIWSDYIQKLENQFKKGDLIALYEALSLCMNESGFESQDMKDGISVPKWALDSILTLYRERILNKAQGPGKNQTADKQAEAQKVHLARYQAVLHFKRNNTTWEESYEKASDLLTSTPYAGTPSTMEASYKKIARKIKKGGFTPHKYITLSE